MFSNSVTDTKNTLFNHSIGELIHARRLNLQSFEPDLRNACHLIRNWFAKYVLLFGDERVVVPTYECIDRYFRALLRCYLHINLSEVYLKMGLDTDSKNKILANSFRNSMVPRYFIDVAREIARPMGAENSGVVYIPYLDPHWHLDRCEHSSQLLLGINPDLCTQFDVVFNEMERHNVSLNRRAIDQEERLLVSPLFVSDAEFVFPSNELSTWRYTCCYLLRHFHNGAVVPQGRLKSWATEPWYERDDEGNRYDEPPPYYPLNADQADRGLFEMQTDTVGALNYSGQYRMQDSLPTHRAVELNPGYNQLELLHAIVDAASFDDGYVERIWLYYRENRHDIYNEWLLRYTQKTFSLPQVTLKESKTWRFLEWTDRFPSSDSSSVASATPKRNGPKPARSDRKPKTSPSTATPVPDVEAGLPAKTVTAEVNVEATDTKPRRQSKGYRKR